MVLAVGKFLEYLSYISIGLIAFLFVLIIWIIFRQRNIIMRIDQIANRVKQTLSNGVDRNKEIGEKQLLAIKETLGEMDRFYEKLDLLEMKVEGVERQIEFNQSGIQESLSEINFSEKENPFDDEIINIHETLDKISTDLAGAHQWLDELRILEKVVLNLIGPDKLRTLIEKEKKQKTTALRQSASHKKSIL